jgi:hypothetical protein
MSYKNTLFGSSNRSIGELIVEGSSNYHPRRNSKSSCVLEYMLYLEEYFFSESSHIDLNITCVRYKISKPKSK